MDLSEIPATGARRVRQTIQTSKEITVNRIYRPFRWLAGSRFAVIFTITSLVAMLVAPAVSASRVKSVPSAGGLIHGCYNKQTHALRIMDPALGACSAQERSLVWNQRGAPGPQGLTGKRGPAGRDGAAGPQGLKGDTGSQGIQGAKGDTGAIGFTGPQGVQGPIGPRGETGANGLMGLQGPQGPQGLVGARGPTGLTGSAGLIGVWLGGWSSSQTYVIGDAVSYNGSSWLAVGPPTVGLVPSSSNSRWSLVAQAGATGATGSTGATGPTGAQGSKGDTGPAGPPGPPGGLSGYEIITNPFTLGVCGVNCPTILSVNCPAGKTVIGGGYRVATPLVSGITFSGGFPVDTLINGAHAFSWQVAATNTGTLSHVVTVYAICATTA